MKKQLKNYLGKFGIAFAAIFLLTFMIFIFGPSEIYFANHVQFDFIFKEYFYTMLKVGVLSALVAALIVALLPRFIYNLILALVTAISIAGYIQVNFMNKNLDLLGLNPDGYQTTTTQYVVNALIWCAIICIFVALYIILSKKDKAAILKKIYLGVAGFLIAIQAVALVTLILGGEEDAFARDEGQVFLSGEKQMMVSKNDNVIVFILDYFSNQYVDRMLAQYPGATDFLNDFTYYDDDECVYHGTYPSIAHMLTEAEMDVNQPVDEWFASIWNNDKTNSFYDAVHKKGYEFNFYSPDSIIIRGMNDMSIFNGKFDNMTNQGSSVKIHEDVLINVLSRTSMYRFAPRILKNIFYVDYVEYLGIVEQVGGKVHLNGDFLTRLQAEGITKDDSKGLIAVHHLNGAHNYNTSADGYNTEVETSLEETCRGCMTVMEAYLNELKAVGKYDDSTIIITSDHGSETEPGIIFYMKKPGEKHDAMLVSHAPISHCEFLPTIAAAAGLDSSSYGQTVEEISETEPRERTYYLHLYDENFPYVQNAWEARQGGFNVYYVYNYTGDFPVLAQKINSNAIDDYIFPVDSYQ